MTKRQLTTTSARQRGLGKFEVIAVVVLLSLVAAILTLVLVPHECTKADAARVDVKMLQDAIKLYAYRDGGSPSSLAELVDAGILERPPTDPWGREYFYTLVGGHPRIRSYGRDGRPGGKSEDADISSSAP